MEQYIQSIEKTGYCIIPQLYDAAATDRALELVREWYRRSQGLLSGNVPYLNRNQPMVYNLQNKDAYFLELIFAAAEVEAILMRFLNDPWFKQIPADQPNYQLRSYLARSSAGALPMHIDSFIPYLGPYSVSMQVAIVLEDMSLENGCTLVVPGSHQAGRYVTQGDAKDAVPVEARRGDVVIWDSRLWHGASENKSGRTRWTAIATFVRWWLKQAFAIPQNLPQEIYERLTPKQKAVLGYCSIPYGDESQGIDMKRGYDSLLPKVADYSKR